MKKGERNGISKEYFILSVECCIAKIWHLKVWEIGSCTQLLNRKFALKSWFKFKKLQNMKKRERNGVSKTYFILSVRRFIAKIWLRKWAADFEKTLFHTVGSCTLWPKQLTCLADGGGWREDQHMWDGQGLKDPSFFKNFFRITKS
jgi:hypothetical protein